MLTVSAAVVMDVVLAVGVPPVLAEPAGPAAAAAKVDAQVGTASTPVANSAKPAAKPTAAKSKARSRAAAKSAKSTPTPAAKAAPEPAAKPSQVMDFDNDEVAGKRLEPGFELIEGAPQRARQSSLVPLSPNPSDSVVNRN